MSIAIDQSEISDKQEQRSYKTLKEMWGLYL